jgi:hypothetical protein
MSTYQLRAEIFDVAMPFDSTTSLPLILIVNDIVAADARCVHVRRP